jgi:MFS family permease
MPQITPMPRAGAIPVEAAEPAARFQASIEGRKSWIVAGITLAILALFYGAQLIVVVGLKPIAQSLGTDRSVLSLAYSLTWIGMGIGGIPGGWMADRVGLRPTVIFGALMTAGGLALSASGSIWALLVGHGLMIGLLGGGAVYAPLLILVARWFDRHRGAALALIQSGQYIAGIACPYLFERGIAYFGWQATMLGFAALVAVALAPMAMFLSSPPQPARSRLSAIGHGRRAVLGLPANAVQGLLCLAGFLCCIPMAIPATHLVAHCSDLGIPAAQGAAMLSVLLGSALVSRQLWGWLADRIGGLRAVLAGSACQAAAVAGFLVTQDEIGLFTVSALYGLGFSGIVPAYVQAIPELFGVAEAAWRVPVFLFTGMGGMAFGGWLGGALYDRFGYYAPAFGAGVAFNLLNLVIVGFLVLRQGRDQRAERR